jgi:hypothetical protein
MYAHTWKRKSLPWFCPDVSDDSYARRYGDVPVRDSHMKRSGEGFLRWKRAGWGQAAGGGKRMLPNFVEKIYPKCENTCT